MMIKFNLSLSLDNVSVTNKDSVFLTGSCKQLGEWHLNKAIEMRPNWPLYYCNRGKTYIKLGK